MRLYPRAIWQLVMLAIDVGHKATRRLGFGAEIPQCPGATLARLELCVALEEFHAGVPDYHLTPGESVRCLSGQQEGVPNYVPITYGPSHER